jgi:ABC-2 type transport system permease protein
MLQLLQAEFKRTWTELVRYPVEVFSSVAVTTFIFYGLFLSARFVAGPQISVSNRVDTMVVGYVLWVLVLSVVNDIAMTLQMEAQTGTLEQIFLSPFNASKIFLVRSVVSLCLRLVLNTSLLLVISLLTGSRLSFSPSLLFPLSSLLLGAYGLSFLMGALALVFKRVEQLLGLFQFSFLLLLAVPTETWLAPFQGLKVLVPMAIGADGMREILLHNRGFNFWQFGLGSINGLVYFSLGLLVFQWAERRAKQQGILSGY